MAPSLERTITPRTFRDVIILVRADSTSGGTGVIVVWAAELEDGPMLDGGGTEPFRALNRDGELVTDLQRHTSGYQQAHRRDDQHTRRESNGLKDYHSTIARRSAPSYPIYQE